MVDDIRSIGKDFSVTRDEHARVRHALIPYEAKMDKIRHLCRFVDDISCICC